VNVSNIGAKMSYSDAAKRDFIPINLRIGPRWTVDLDEYNSLSFNLDVNKLLVPTPPVYLLDSSGNVAVDDQGNFVIASGKDPDRGVAAGMFGSFSDAPGVVFYDDNQNVQVESGSILREELRGSSVEDFATRVVNVTNTAFQTLGIPTTLAQVFVVRSLIAPRHFRDGREFLSRRLVAPGADAWQSFGRPLQSLGVRLVFPPQPGGRDTFQVRIETWPQDARSLWLENTGSFTGPVAASDTPQLAELLHQSYRYLCGPVCDFLATLDTP
jgi:hypothetical protein